MAVGKIKEAFYRDALAEYKKRLQKYCSFSIIEVADEKTVENATATEIDQIKDKEGQRLLKYISDKDFCITLEIAGRQLDSVAFSDYIEERMVSGVSSIVFVIGGSLGLSTQVCDRSNFSLSFSKMTFPHQFMRVILSEQIYRAFRIMKNEPYHK